jgi:hypothetical protein
MKVCNFIFMLCMALQAYQSDLSAQKTSDSLEFSGQLTGWGGFSFKNPGIQQLGIRYLPELSYSVHNAHNLNFDIDASVNSYSNIRFDQLHYDTIQAGIRPYRLSARISSDQWEIRAGLQKISFGSASILRPLMWFDKIDARDPLQLTDGVYGVLGRYYFLNNANIWIWGLYGNKERRGWDYFPSSPKKPEFGGRVQLPVLSGDLAFTYHHRYADHSHDALTSIPAEELVFPENKFGLDGKWDIGAGIWFEYVYKNSKTSIVYLIRQEHYLNLGSDYTLLVGNGLNLSAEHFMLSSESNLNHTWNAQNFTAFSTSYPFGTINRASLMVFYNYEKQNWYRFINFQRQYNNLSLYLMLYWNPDNFILYSGSDEINMFSGKGIQIMLSFNH